MKRIVIAGATGNIGGKIVKYLLKKDVALLALVRKETKKSYKDTLSTQGAAVVALDLLNPTEVTKACRDADGVIVHTQKVLVDAAVAAGVPRFIPSDFRNLVYGKNRNLDLRKKFYEYSLYRRRMPGR